MFVSTHCLWWFFNIKKTHLSRGSPDHQAKVCCPKIEISLTFLHWVVWVLPHDPGLQFLEATPTSSAWHLHRHWSHDPLKQLSSLSFSQAPPMGPALLPEIRYAAFWLAASDRSRSSRVAPRLQHVQQWVFVMWDRMSDIRSSLDYILDCLDQQTGVDVSMLSWSVHQMT